MKAIAKFMLVFIAIFASGCAIFRHQVSGSGAIEEREHLYSGGVYELKIEINTGDTPVEIAFFDGASPSLKLITDDNILKEIAVKENGREIKVSGDKKTFYDATEFRVEIYGMTFSKLTLYGGFHIEPTEAGFTEDFVFVVHGGLSGACDFGAVTGELDIRFKGDVDLKAENVRATKLKVKSEGAVDLEMEGAAGNFYCQGEGSANINAPDLRCQDISLNLKGAVNVVVYAEETLEIIAEGTGVIKYRGQPDITHGTKGAFSITPY